MLNCFAVGLGGFVGAVLRYLISLINLNDSTAFPYKTLITNVIGSFAIGLIVAFVAKKTNIDPRVVLFLKVGVCGGFTTFSTFALESSQLMQSGKVIIAILYMLLSVLLCVLAVLGAMAIIK